MKVFFLGISALEDEDITLRRNMGIRLSIYAVSNSTRTEPSATPVRKPQNWKGKMTQFKPAGV
jgi:hypothetical protein